jgi:hypothetical protein
MESDTRVLDHRSKLLDLHMSGSICEGRKRRFITRSGTCCGKRQSKRSALLQPSKDRTKNQSRGQKVCINNPSHRCVPVVQWGLVDHYLSLCSSSFPKKLLLLSSLKRSNLFPKTWLLQLWGAASILQEIILIWGMVCPANLLFPRGSFVPLL